MGATSPASRCQRLKHRPNGMPRRLAAVIPHGEAARAAWRQLGRRTRRLTLLLAIRGRPHPDPTVAAIAVRMAQHIRHLPWSGWLVGIAASAVLWPVSVWLLSSPALGIPCLTGCSAASPSRRWLAPPLACPRCSSSCGYGAMSKRPTSRPATVQPCADQPCPLKRRGAIALEVRGLVLPWGCAVAVGTEQWSRTANSMR
jgi:hypothetical protein